MKVTSLATLAFLLFSSASFAQDEPQLHPDDPLITPRGLRAEVISDADGDQLPDDLDPNPLIPDAPDFTWWVSDVTVGWDLDEKEIDRIQAETGREINAQRRTSFTVKGGIGGGGGYSFGFDADPASILLSLIPGGALLQKSGGEAFKTQNHLAVSFGFDKSRQRSRTVQEIRSEFDRWEKERAIKNRHIEFTVEFFNRTEDTYQFSGFSIPVQTPDRQTRAEALCYVAGKEVQEFMVPGHRPSGYPVRFRANLTTTQSEQILDALERGTLTIALDRANGTAINLLTQVDEIARRQKIEASVAESTVSLTFRTPESSTSWRVARTNPLTGNPTTVGEAIAAINRMTATADDPDYLETSAGLVYAVGSFRNTTQNAFEVTNTETVPLQVVGWTRANQYGPDRAGQWEHGLGDALGDGALFLFAPYMVTKEDLARQIRDLDPSLSGEWLALCHFWLHYDEKKPFVEYPLSVTDYPLCSFFGSLEPDFARSDFDLMVSAWLRNGGGAQFAANPGSLDNQDFREKVRAHRQSILNAAFAGYTEAGALLTRIPDIERDELESRAIHTALSTGNLDAAAMEQATALFRQRSLGRELALESVELPRHIFSQNLLGFLHFVECERGTRAGTSRDAALSCFSFAASRGNHFGKAMKGWLLLNSAEQERKRWFSDARWIEERDEGIRLLRDGALGSAVGNYVLAQVYLNSRIGIERNDSLGKSYLQAAAKMGFIVDPAGP